MPKDIFTGFRLSVMQDLLPISLAVVDRVRKEGFQGVVDIFNTSNQPFQDFRSEGESSAQYIRDKLDQLGRSSGDPVEPVDVEINNNEPVELEPNDLQELMFILNNIDKRMNLLDQIINDDL
tara:strand:- start:740 stop:1105 length:366 start_codon:yes stop_codon:yes gene_type:complete